VSVAVLLAGAILFFRALGWGADPWWADAVRAGLLATVGACVAELRERVRRSGSALRASEQQYRQLTEKSLAGIFIYRGDVVLYVNPRCAEMLGYSREALIGRSIWEMIYEPDKPKVADFLMKRETEGFSDLRYECRAICADGRVIWLDLASVVIHYHNNLAVLVYMYDITDRKESEEQRRELSELARKQQEQLVHSTRLAELGEMAASVAHEINQPLTGIRNFARNAVYMLEHEAGSVDEVKDNLRLISAQVDRASRIISQMRELTARSERHYAPVDVNDTVRDSVEFLMPQMRLSRVETTLELAEALPKVLGGRVRLEQVLLNLLTNARQAMEETVERRLTVRTYLDTESERPVVIEVLDTGEGFAPEDAEKIFTPFYSTKQPAHGTGLGLSISLTIVKEHNGTIEATGVPGRGARFVVRLPAMAETPEPKETVVHGQGG